MLYLTLVPTASLILFSICKRAALRYYEAFLDDSVSFMASSTRVEFSAELRTTVVAKASALLTSVRRTSSHPPGLLSVRQAWSNMDNSSL